MAIVHSWKLVGFGTAALIAGFAFTGGCSSNSDNSARMGTGGTAATTSGGATSLGGATTTAGSGTVIAGSTGTSGGSTGTAGGATSGGAPSGGAGTDVCGLPTTTAPTPVIYDGVTTAPTCGTSIKMPYATYWFTYGDETVCQGLGKPADADRTAKSLPVCTVADPGALTNPGMNGGVMGGCQGPTDCAFHVAGSGYADYGAGVGFDLKDNASQTAQPFDATPYMGVQFWAKGTISGTRGPKYAATANSLHVKFVTMTDCHGDDFGGYCTIGTDWTKCNLTFAAATRDGFSAMPDPTADTLDLASMEKIQLEFSKFSPAADAGTSPPVAFDVTIDDVSFF